MRYWLFVTDGDNWKVIRDKEIYGFNDKTKKLLDKLNENDLVIIYIKGKLIGGCFQIISLKEESKIKFNGGEYPYKIKLKKIIIPENPMDFTKNMICRISIFKDKKRWGTILMGRATKEITQNDYKFLEEQLRC